MQIRNTFSISITIKVVDSAESNRPHYVPRGMGLLGMAEPEGRWWVALCTVACVIPPSRWIGRPTTELRLVGSRSLTGKGEWQPESGLRCSWEAFL